MLNEMIKKGLVQAPLAGVSCAPFRRLAHKWGQPDWCCSEMLSANHIVHGLLTGAPQKKRFIYKAQDEGLLCIQLAVAKPEVAARATEEVSSWGADIIDLNTGCPQRKIRKKNLGSALLTDPDLLHQIVCAMVRSTDCPITVKIRVDDGSGSQDDLAVAEAVQAAGAAALIVHGRNWQEDYSNPVRVDSIRAIKHSVSIPVIANGDVSDVQTAKDLLASSESDGIMIARGSVGRPWLFAEIHSAITGGHFDVPDDIQIGEMFLQHIDGLINLDGEKSAALQSRSLGKYYARHRINATNYAQLIKISSWQDAKSWCDLVFCEKD